ncbi:MAG: ribosomal-processing cysteine protease Prp [bacterium]|nr:ribosomal-processing cysteine protease Prp [bacterium]
MIKVKIERDKNGHIIKFYGVGHARFRKKGEDIVCASVSVLLQTARLGLKDYLHLNVEAIKRDAFLDVSIEGGDSREKADIILETMVLGLKAIENSYPGYLKVIDSKKNGD